MKRFILLAAVLMMVCGCGGGSGSGGDSSATPVLSELTYTPSSVAKNSGGGTVDVTGTALVVTPGGNVVQCQVMTLDSSGKVTHTTTVPVSAPPEATSVRIKAVFTVSTTQAGSFPFAVSATDKNGRETNWEYGTFVVTGTPTI